MFTSYLSRRSVLRLAVGTAALPLLEACAPGSAGAAAVTQAIVVDVSQVAQALTLTVKSLAAADLPTPAALATIVADVTKFSGIAAGIVPNLSAVAAEPLAKQLVAILGDMLAVGAAVAPPPYGTAIAIAETLVPLAFNAIESLLGRPVAASAPRAGAFSPDEARAELAKIIGDVR